MGRLAEPGPTFVRAIRNVEAEVGTLAIRTGVEPFLLICIKSCVLTTCPGNHVQIIGKYFNTCKDEESSGKAWIRAVLRCADENGCYFC